MRKNLLLFILALVAAPALFAQSLLLYNEDFESGGTGFTLNSGGPNANTGTNQWIVNNNYNGAPTYNNTISEDSTYSGTISYAPFSYNLHIYDVPTGIDNCNYDPANNSDRFAYMTSGVCTSGMDSVHISFFYMCSGSPTAYGEIYYSRNSGPWQQVGLTQYNNHYKWQYEDLTLASFDDCADLRFGFRWVNTAGSSPDSIAMAVDDISIVGTYNTAATIVVDSVSPNPVCRGGLLFIYWHLTDTLCDGTYSIDLSDQFGNFNTTNAWVAGINNPQTSGVFAIILPNSVVAGNCYKIRIRRTGPPPVFTGIASGCFQIINCPNTITTLQPVVTFDTNSVCVGSAIDVPFYSTGIFNANNVYTAQLSDSNGVFASTPPVIGTSPDPSTYDPSLGSPPGTVSGLVPLVPAGCGYYIRVVSSNPATIGTPWGPFCIGHCDITTNNHQDLDFCVTDCAIDPAGADTSITIDVNTYNSTTTYAPGNIFTTQLLSSMTFGQIGSNGILGSVAATDDTILHIHVPCKDSLPIYGIPLGMNYLRVVATQSSVPDDALGSLIRFTVGAPRSTAEIITSYDFTTFTPRDTFCVGDIVALFFSPYNYSDHSTYMWECNGINSGQPFVSPSGANSNSLYVNLGAAGMLIFRVQETSYGCIGPWSPWDTIIVVGNPLVTITGLHNVCQNDTVTYSTVFSNNTYYSWWCTGGNIVDTANNIIDIVFPNTGTFQLHVTAVNECAQASSVFLINVNPFPAVAAGPDTTVCSATSITLSTPTGTGYSYAWSTGATQIGTTSSITVTPTVTTTYYINTSNATGCNSYDTVTVFVGNLNDSLSATQSQCTVFDGTATATITTGTAPYTYQWSDGQTTQTAVGLPPGSYTCVVTDATGCSYTSSILVPSISGLNPDAGLWTTITQGDSWQLNGTGGGVYSWTPASSLSCNVCQNPIASPTVTTTYTLTVSDTLGCVFADTVTIFVDINCGKEFVPNAFSPNGDGQNDYLFARGVCLEYADFTVYNRWGEQVFHTTDITKGWDGVWRGVPCETAVFTWVLKGTRLDGTDVNMHGNVSLIK